MKRGDLTLVLPPEGVLSEKDTGTTDKVLLALR